MEVLMKRGTVKGGNTMAYHAKSKGKEETVKTPLKAVVQVEKMKENKVYDVNEQNELKNIEIVDELLSKNIDPTEEEMSGWNIDMIAYFKTKKKVKRRSFKFANFIPDKEEFIPLVKQFWKSDLEGCNMFKMVNILKSLKGHLKKLAWKNGDIFENVIKLRNDFKDVQMKIDRDPDNKELRKKEC
ncbi:hypothetical protein Tco_1505305 [Tanacetum coccineum]